MELMKGSWSTTRKIASGIGKNNGGWRRPVCVYPFHFCLMYDLVGYTINCKILFFFILFNMRWLTLNDLHHRRNSVINYF